MIGKNNITIMALGGAGCRILGEFSSLEAAKRFRLLAVDSDILSLQETGLPEENLLQAGKLLRSGKGCGGDAVVGQQALANERKALNSLLADTRVLIIVAGMGGGLASGGLSVILGVAAKLHIITAVVATLPFSMEGYRRRQLAEDKIQNDILPIADAVVTLPNDLLFSTLEAETSLADAFKLSDQEMARSVLALASVLGGGNLFSADFASFSGVLKRRHALCAIGTAFVKNNVNAADSAVEKLLTSPLLGGPGSVDTADALIISLLGGPELSLGSARAVLDLCSRQVDNDPEKVVLLGAATADELTGNIQLSILTVRYLDNPVADAAVAKQTKRGMVSDNVHSEASRQMDLPLIMENKGIMENTSPIIYDGEDLDVPTFRRRGMVVDIGR